MKKRWMIVLLACCLLVGITGSAAYAYLIDKKEVVNQMSVLENTTHIEEEFETPDDVKPGQVIKKKPRIVNDSAIPVYTRAQVVFSSLQGEEQCHPLVITDSWKKREDGYYYYQKKILPGQCTSTIFDNIVIKNTIKKEDLVSFDILVYEESVQAEGFYSPEEAFAGL